MTVAIAARQISDLVVWSLVSSDGYYFADMAYGPVEVQKRESRGSSGVAMQDE